MPAAGFVGAGTGIAPGEDQFPLSRVHGRVVDGLVAKPYIPRDHPYKT